MILAHAGHADNTIAALIAAIVFALAIFFRPRPAPPDPVPRRPDPIRVVPRRNVFDWQHDDPDLSR